MNKQIKEYLKRRIKEAGNIKNSYYKKILDAKNFNRISNSK
jgi:hypothetical protein